MKKEYLELFYLLLESCRILDEKKRQYRIYRKKLELRTILLTTCFTYVKMIINQIYRIFVQY
jgi:hypothetical protein